MIVNIQSVTYDTKEDCAKPDTVLGGPGGRKPGWVDSPHEERTVVIDAPRFRIVLEMSEAEAIVRQYHASKRITSSG